MNLSIDFNDKPMFPAQKVGDEGTHGDLPAKFQAGTFSIAQRSPKDLLPYLGQANLERHIRWRAPRHYDDPLKIATLQYIFDYSDLLTGYVRAENLFHSGCPKTTNLIESYNKQLNGRLKTIQGFQSFSSAERWLSAWILRRRLTPFTDCRGKFRHLNGICSLEKTRMRKFKLPALF